MTRRRHLSAAFFVMALLGGLVVPGAAVADTRPSATVELLSSDWPRPLTVVAPGERVGVRAAGMRAGESVTLTVGAQTVVATAGGDGTARSALPAFTVPLDTAVAVSVAAAGATSGRAARIAVPLEPPTLVVEYVSGPTGPILLTGSGFGVGSTVSFTADTAPAPAPVVVGAAGQFHVSATAPPVGVATETLVATDGIRSARATATVPPPTLRVSDLGPAVTGHDIYLAGGNFVPGSTVTATTDTDAGGSLSSASPVVDAQGGFGLVVDVPTTACPGVTVTVAVRDPLSGLAATAPPVTTQPGWVLGTGTDGRGCTVSAGTTLTSTTGQFRLVTQADGNLVLYAGARAVWATQTSGPGARLVMQADGNLVLYAGARPLWSTGTAGIGPGAQLVVQPDGNVVLYDAQGRPRWSTGRAGSDRLLRGDRLEYGWAIRSSNGRYRLVIDNGDMTVDDSGSRLWDAKVNPNYAELQPDGNFVAYLAPASEPGTPPQPLFTTATRTGSALVMQDDGNLVLYDAAGRAVWSIR